MKFESKMPHSSKPTTNGSKTLESTLLLCKTDLLAQDLVDHVTSLMFTWTGKDGRAKKKLEQQLGQELKKLQALLSKVHTNLETVLRLNGKYQLAKEMISSQRSETNATIKRNFIQTKSPHQIRLEDAVLCDAAVFSSNKKAKTTHTNSYTTPSVGLKVDSSKKKGATDAEKIDKFVQHTPPSGKVYTLLELVDNMLINDKSVIFGMSVNAVGSLLYGLKKLPCTIKTLQRAVKQFIEHGILPRVGDDGATRGRKPIVTKEQIQHLNDDVKKNIGTGKVQLLPTTNQISGQESQSKHWQEASRKTNQHMSVQKKPTSLA